MAGVRRPLSGVHVLVVDDNDDARTLLEMYFESCGALVTAVASVRQALRILQSIAPTVIVSDLAMPREDGYALIKAVRAHLPENGGDTPAIAMSAYAGAPYRARALAAGFQAYVTKPIDFQQLGKIVETLANEHRPELRSIGS